MLDLRRPLNDGKNQPAGYPEPEANVGYQLWLATNAMIRVHQRTLEPLMLTFVQFLILSAVFRLDSPHTNVRQSDICAFCGTDPNMTSQVVRTLVKKGMLERGSNPSDRRAYALTITPAGKTLVVAARERLREPVEALLAPLGDRQTEFIELLRGIIAATGRPMDAD